MKTLLSIIWERGLKTHHSLIKYTREFKRDTLNFIKAARQFELSSRPMISCWKKKYIAGGQTALPTQRERPKKGWIQKKQDTSKLSCEKGLDRGYESLWI